MLVLGMEQITRILTGSSGSVVQVCMCVIVCGHLCVRVCVCLVQVILRVLMDMYYLPFRRMFACMQLQV